MVPPSLKDYFCRIGLIISGRKRLVEEISFFLPHLFKNLAGDAAQSSLREFPVDPFAAHCPGDGPANPAPVSAAINPLGLCDRGRGTNTKFAGFHALRLSAAFSYLPAVLLHNFINSGRRSAPISLYQREGKAQLSFLGLLASRLTEKVFYFRIIKVGPGGEIGKPRTTRGLGCGAGTLL